jgi:hypothetical protein
VSERNPRSAWSTATGAVLAISFALRSALVLRGGQQFWPDEDRFDYSRTAARDLLGGHLLAAARVEFGSADHILFRILATVPALAECVFRSGPWLAGLFFAAASTAMLWAAGRLARSAGGGEREQFFTVFAAAASASLFYYARHFVPYDLSLFMFLLALALAMGPERTLWRGCGVGLWAAGGFLAYNGYWTLVPVTAGLFLATAVDWRSLFVSAAGFGVGFLVPNAAAVAIGRGLGFDLVASYAAFSRTTTQGDLDQAWRFVGEYFWQAEGVNAAVFVAALGVTVWVAWRNRGSMGGIYGALIAMVLYALIVLGSDVLLRITVAARHIRVIAPFCAWTIGAALAWIAGRGWWGRAAALGCSALIAVAAAANFAAPLAQVFPRDFLQAARSEIGSDRAAGDGLQPLRILNNWFFHNPTWISPTPPDARTLWSRPHPFAYVPYLFEGYNEAGRAAYLEHERTMKVLRFDGVSPIRGYPYAFKLTCTPLARDATEVSEPILCSGSTGAGDLIFLQSRSDGTAQVGIDHWGSGDTHLSKPFPFLRGREHTFIVIAPCLVGGQAISPAELRRTQWWSHHVFVSVDGATVVNVSADFFPSKEYEVSVALNAIDSSSAQTSMQIDSARFSPLQESDWAKAESAP